MPFCRFSAIPKFYTILCSTREALCREKWNRKVKQSAEGNFSRHKCSLKHKFNNKKYFHEIIEFFMNLSLFDFQFLSKSYFRTFPLTNSAHFLQPRAENKIRNWSPAVLYPLNSLKDGKSSEKLIFMRAFLIFSYCVRFFFVVNSGWDLEFLISLLQEHSLNRSHVNQLYPLCWKLLFGSSARGLIYKREQS